MGGNEAVDAARKQLGKPYVWGAAPYTGGKVPSSFDCSSLVQYAWMTQGITIPRTTDTQWTSDKLQKIEKKDLAAGDLIYFGWTHPHDHVALYWGDNTIIEAANANEPVKTTKMTDYYWKKVTGYRRVKGGGVEKQGIVERAQGAISGAGTIGGSIADTGISGLTDTLKDTVSSVQEVGKLAFKLTQPSTWVRVGAIAVGLVFVVGGLVFVAKEVRD